VGGPHSNNNNEYAIEEKKSRGRGNQRVPELVDLRRIAGANFNWGGKLCRGKVVGCISIGEVDSPAVKKKRLLGGKLTPNAKGSARESAEHRKTGTSEDKKTRIKGRLCEEPSV